MIGYEVVLLVMDALVLYTSMPATGVDPASPQVVVFDRDTRLSNRPLLLLSNSNRALLFGKLELLMVPSLIFDWANKEGAITENARMIAILIAIWCDSNFIKLDGLKIKYKDIKYLFKGLGGNLIFLFHFTPFSL